ncbi:MAG: prolyl oligopeptidase family serine peptidase [Alphaproteobacteria bacterium]
MKKYCLLWVFSSFLSLAASSFYSLSLEKLNEDLASSEFVTCLKGWLPSNATLKEVICTQVVNNRIDGIFVQYTLNGSVNGSPDSEALGILVNLPDGRQHCHELINASPDNLDRDSNDKDAFFFDSTSGNIFFTARYGKSGTANSNVLQESKISVINGNIEHISDTIVTGSIVSGYRHAQGKISSYEVLREGSLYFYFRNAKGKFKMVATYAANPTTTSMLALWCGQTKHIYKYEVDPRTGLASLHWLSPSKCRFKPTNFINHSCSLFSTGEDDDNVITVSPTNPRNILGYLTHDKGAFKPVWMERKHQELFVNAEEALRAKLQEKTLLFSNASNAFSYKTISSIFDDHILGSLSVLGFKGFVQFCYAQQGGLYYCDDSSLISDKKVYDHEFVEASSSIKNEADTTVYYSVFKRTEAAGGVDNTKKTLAYIMGGPWATFSIDSFLESYQPFINEGYTIIVPHEPMRNGFGYKYMFAEKQLGRRNLNHTMNILDDASKNGANSQMVLMGESYGGWVASALAATWNEFKPAGSSIELRACIAQVANLDLRHWREEILKRGCSGLSTFADNPVDVASITKLQAPLLIFHGLGDVRCPIESIQKWANLLKEANQPLAFLTAPEGHAGILQSSCGNKESLLRQNIVRRFFEGNTVPAASAEKLAEFSLSVLHDNLGLFEDTVNSSSSSSSGTI